MSFWNDLVHRLQALLSRRRKEAELDDELRFHLDMEIERRVAGGEERAAAARAARLAFGSPEAVKEACRDAWGTRLLDDAWRDLRGAIRQLANAPAFTFAAVASLAIGLGAAAVIFSLVDAVLLRPLPYGEPHRIVRFFELTPEGGRFSTSDLNLADFRRGSQTLDHITAMAYPEPRPALDLGGERIRLEAQAVTASFFSVFGVQAQLGRTFDPAQEGPGDVEHVAVLTDDGWRRYFAADREVVGREIDLDGESWTVIGVLPAGFRLGGSTTDIFLPYRINPQVGRGDHRLTAFARLKAGATAEQAGEEVKAVAAALATEYPQSNAGWSAEVVPIEEILLGADLRRTNFVLLGAVLLLLVIACVNVSNLLLARAADRGEEIRLRLALGASRERLIRQMMTESLLLGGLGAACGLALSLWGVPLVRGLGVPLPRMDQMHLDLRIFAFLGAIALLSSLLFGLAPALRATRTPAGGTLSARRQGPGVESQRLRSALVVAEVALATVLTVAAGLLLSSFGALQRAESGLTSEGVVLARFDLPDRRYGEGAPQTVDFYSRLVERVAELPAVEAAGATTISPYQGPELRNSVGRAEEQDREAFVPIHWRSVSGGSFRALGIPLMRGRSFDDRGKAKLETVISAGLAARLWPAEDPVGKRLRWISPQGPEFEVIGVAGEVQDLELGAEALPLVYLPQGLVGWPTMTLAVRSGLPRATLVAAISKVVRDLDPLLAAPVVTTLAEQRREALGRPLLILRLLAITSLIALVLAAVGVYGILAFALSRRRRELGVRVAMGARPGQMARLVVAGGGRLVGLGLALGLLASFGLARTLQALLYQTSPVEPAVLVAVTGVLLAVGLGACGFPAWRAARLDPLKALREE